MISRMSISGSFAAIPSDLRGSEVDLQRFAALRRVHVEDAAEAPRGGLERESSIDQGGSPHQPEGAHSCESGEEVAVARGSPVQGVE